MHDATSDAVENLPAAHSTHELAPAADPLFVSEPAAHRAQVAAELELVEYLPGTHFVHVAAPAADPVSVIDPA